MSTATSSTQLQSLQILRAVAATSVVYFHTFLAPHFGSFGVELFFVLSGLVITMVAESGIGWFDFLIARITRIAPAYWMLTTALVIVAAARPDVLNSPTPDAGDYLRSILFIPYFKSNGSLTPVLPVGWTLNYEMLFYVLAAVGIAVARGAFLVVTATLVVAAWILGHMLPATSAAGEFLRSGELFEFIFGMCAWKCRNTAWLLRIPAPVALCSAAVLYSAMAWCESVHALLGPQLRIPSLVAYEVPSFLVVLLAVRLEPALQHVNRHVVAAITHIGDASYATYLTHLFVIEFLGKIMALRLPGVAPDTPVGALLAVLVSLAVGSAIYVLLDMPSVRAARRLMKRRLRGGVAKVG